MDWTEILPEKYHSEFRLILYGINDDTQHPTDFLKTVDRFFRRVCDDEGFDFDEMFGDHYAKLSKVLGGLEGKR